MASTEHPEITRSLIWKGYAGFACLALAAVGIQLWPQFKDSLWPCVAVLGIAIMFSGWASLLWQFKTPVETESENTILYKESRGRPMLRFSISKDWLFIRTLPGPVVLDDLIPLHEITHCELQRKWFRPYLKISGVSDGIAWDRELPVKSSQRVIEALSTQGVKIGST